MYESEEPEETEDDTDDEEASDGKWLYSSSSGCTLPHQRIFSTALSVALPWVLTIKGRLI